MIRKIAFGACVALSVASMNVTAYAQTFSNAAYSAENKVTEYQEGKTTQGVNVRVGAGANNDKLMYKNKGVSLSKDTIVTILDTVDVSGKPWYHIRFDYNGEELEGYSTSTYIELTGHVITPTPLPTPTPEPTLTPAPTPVPTKQPEVTQAPAPTVVPTESKNTESHKAPYLLLAGVAAAALALVAYFILKRKPSQRSLDSYEVSKKVEKLKNMAVDADRKKEAKEHKKVVNEHKEETKDSKLDVAEKQNIEARVSKRDKILSQAEKAENDKVYVKGEPRDVKDIAGSMSATLTKKVNGDVDIKDTMEQDTAEKRALRTAIANLKEHDIVIHKYFGKGEVYDNSDVHLIEVRFGSDVRFLNKEQLVTRRLIEITNEKNR